jgi:hypothetical protein
MWQVIAGCMNSRAQAGHVLILLGLLLHGASENYIKPCICAFSA